MKTINIFDTFAAGLVFIDFSARFIELETTYSTRVNASTVETIEYTFPESTGYGNYPVPGSGEYLPTLMDSRRLQSINITSHHFIDPQRRIFGRLRQGVRAFFGVI